MYLSSIQNAYFMILNGKMDKKKGIDALTYVVNGHGPWVMDFPKELRSLAARALESIRAAQNKR